MNHRSNNVNRTTTPAIKAALFVVDTYIRVRGIRVKGTTRLKTIDIFVPLAMPFGIKHAEFPYIMQMTSFRKQILYIDSLKQSIVEHVVSIDTCCIHVRCLFKRVATV